MTNYHNLQEAYGRRRSLAAAASCRPAHRPPRRRLLACRMRSPTFQVPSVAAAVNPAERLPRDIATGSHSWRVHAHAIPAPEPACHTALREDNQERTRGRPCGSVPVAYAWWQPPASGPVRSRRSFAAAASCRPAHRPPRRRLLACRPRSPPHFMSPVWQPPPLRVERLPRTNPHLPRPTSPGRTTDRSRTTNSR